MTTDITPEQALNSYTAASARTEAARKARWEAHGALDTAVSVLKGCEEAEELALGILRQTALIAPQVTFTVGEVE